MGPGSTFCNSGFGLGRAGGVGKRKRKMKKNHVMEPAINTK